MKANNSRCIQNILEGALFVLTAAFLCGLCEAQTAPGEVRNRNSPMSRSTEEQGPEKPLKTFDWVDTSSPRAVLSSLLTGTQRYYDLIRRRGYTYENWHEVRNISRQAERLFDLRDIPPGVLGNASHEVMVLLREALARIPLPPLEDIPGESEVAVRVREGQSTVFRIPNTPFEIARIDEGPQAGRYQFTRETVAHVHSFFMEIRGYPYDSDQRSVDGFYEAYFLSPGPAIPHEWIQSLPRWMKAEYLDQTVWQWALLALSCVFLLLILYTVHRLTRRISRDWNELPRSLVLLIRPALTILLAAAVARFLYYDVRITAEVARVVDFFKHLLILFASVEMTMRLGSVLAELILTSKRLERQAIDQQFIRLMIRLCSVIIATVIVIEEMQQIGFSVATLVAGAGVGGLAIALAAQDTLKNIFGGIELSLDKPFSVGERIRLKTYDGDIEQIGLRSTKIRTRDGHHVTIPNEELAKLDIENIGRRPYIRRRFSITITYDTPVEKIGEAMDILKDILSVPQTGGDGGNAKLGKETSDAVHPNVAINRPDYAPRVFFSDLNADSLDLLVHYWYFPPDHWAYREHKSWVNLQIIERFNAASIDFAFPTRTVHLVDSDHQR